MTTDMPLASFRPGRDLLLELQARGDRIGLVAKAMCERYLEMVAELKPAPAPIEQAKQMYRSWQGDYPDRATEYGYIDALERAHILVERDGMAVEDALKEVGLVA